jgi:hypothetical protein
VESRKFLSAYRREIATDIELSNWRGTARVRFRADNVEVITQEKAQRQNDYVRAHIA